MNDTLLDPRVYLQRRVALFMRVSCIFFLGLMLLDFATPAPGEPLLGSTRVAGLATLATSAAIWAITRTQQRPMWLCRSLELAAMGVAMGVYATLPLNPPIQGAGGVMAMFTPIMMAIVTLLRAAVIPSPAWLSVLVGLCWGSLMTLSGTLGWEGVKLTLPGLLDANGFAHSSFEALQATAPQRADALRPWLLPFSMGLLATIGFSFVAGVISHVVYGLQAKVRAAMEFGQYTLEAKIGEGGMGTVYRARHRMLRRPTAIKLLPPEKAGERSIARFEREVQQTSRLSHPNTVSIFDFGRTQDGIFYYAMEYLEGVSLEKLVQMAGALPPARVVHVLTQAAESLSEAHGMGLVHRDIKPDNMVLCERGGALDVLKVLDFGLVKAIDDKDPKLSAENALQGTPLYMAPESVTDPNSVDARADLYALGAVAYFLLTGKPVFTGKLVEVLMHHMKTEPPALPNTSDMDVDLRAIVARCLEKEPADRYASAAELAEALRDTALAGRWTQAQARAWWDQERDRIEALRSREEGPTNLTIARVSTTAPA